MICSEKELGLPETVDGVLILPPDTPLGRPLAEVLDDAGDVILELEGRKLVNDKELQQVMREEEIRPGDALIAVG